MQPQITQMLVLTTTLDFSKADKSLCNQTEQLPLRIHIKCVLYH